MLRSYGIGVMFLCRNQNINIFREVVDVYVPGISCHL